MHRDELNGFCANLALALAEFAVPEDPAMQAELGTRVLMGLDQEQGQLYPHSGARTPAQWIRNRALDARFAAGASRGWWSR